MNVSIETIKILLQKELPGTRAHSRLLPPKRVLKPAPADKSKVKKSSVLLLLFQQDGELMACLIKRPKHMKHHAGQIALPGGRMETGETAIETAVRETYEEIGVGENEIEILGSLSKFYVEVSRFEIQPIVGYLHKLSAFHLSPDEVEKLIFFPIRCFAPPHKFIELETVTGKLQVPCVYFENEIIWGATAMILSEFYDVINSI